MILLVLCLLLSLQLTGSNDIRLVGGASPCAGELQVRVFEGWREVIFEWFYLETAAAVCRRLDCGSVLSQVKNEAALLSAVRINTVCVKSTAPMIECIEDPYTESRYRYNITCSDSVRLVHGPSLCSGSLEVRRSQSWSLVCEEDFDLKAAEVVCRELGCGAPSLLQGALYGGGFVPVRQTFQCEGHESALMDCPSSGLANSNCASGNAVKIICSVLKSEDQGKGEVQLQTSTVGLSLKTHSAPTVYTVYQQDFKDHELLRLVNSSDACAGTVELRFREQWRRMTGEVRYADLPMEIAAKVCPLLDCGPSVSAHFIHLSEAKLVWLLYPECVRNPHNLRECALIADHYAAADIKVKCSDIRLVGGASPCAGELQVILSSGEWRAVTFSEFFPDTAAAVCRRLDCGSVLSQKRREGASLPAVQISSECANSSAPVTECVEDPNATSRYRYSIICSDSVRLVHGSSLCSGSLEVRRSQSWSLVCEEDFDLKAAEVVCRELGCGAHSLLQGALYGGGSVPVRQMFQCEGHESALMDCPRSSLVHSNCASGNAVTLICAVKPNYTLLWILVPVAGIIVVAVIALIVYKTKKSTNAQEATESPQPPNPEEHIYQSLHPGSADQEYMELHQLQSE